MTVEIENTPLKYQFLEALQSNDLESLHKFLDNQNISDVAELIYEFPEHEGEILGNLSIHRAISTFKILDFAIQKRIIQELSPSKTAELLNGLPADDRTSFLEDLPNEVVKELIKMLDPEERKITLSLLGYPESSVGRLMTPDYIAVQKDWTIRQVIRHIRDVGKDSETIDVIYVVDEKGIFIDDIKIREIILADPDKKVEDVIDNRFIYLNVNDDQETANQAFKMNNRMALPVLDNNKLLLGIVTIDDVLWVATEEFTEDIQKIGGTEALDHPYLETPFFQLIRKRVGWLIILFLSEMLTATAMAYYNDELAKWIILTNFIPLIMSSGGNSGSQASTLIIQAMALGEVTLKDWWRVMRREILSGFYAGRNTWSHRIYKDFCMAPIMVRGVFKDNYGFHWDAIGLSVSFSLVGVVLWGTLAGSMLPIVLKKLAPIPPLHRPPSWLPWWTLQVS